MKRGPVMRRLPVRAGRRPGAPDGRPRPASAYSSGARGGLGPVVARGHVALWCAIRRRSRGVGEQPGDVAAPVASSVAPSSPSMPCATNSLTPLRRARHDRAGRRSGPRGRRCRRTRARPARRRPRRRPAASRISVAVEPPGQLDPVVHPVPPQVASKGAAGGRRPRARPAAARRPAPARTSRRIRRQRQRALGAGQPHHADHRRALSGGDPEAGRHVPRGRPRWAARAPAPPAPSIDRSGAARRSLTADQVDRPAPQVASARGRVRAAGRAATTSSAPSPASGAARADARRAAHGGERREHRDVCVHDVGL